MLGRLDLGEGDAMHLEMHECKSGEKEGDSRWPEGPRTFLLHTQYSK